MCGMTQIIFCLFVCSMFFAVCSSYYEQLTPALLPMWDKGKLLTMIINNFINIYYGGLGERRRNIFPPPFTQSESPHSIIARSRISFSRPPSGAYLDGNCSFCESKLRALPHFFSDSAGEHTPRAWKSAPWEHACSRGS